MDSIIAKVSSWNALRVLIGTLFLLGLITLYKATEKEITLVVNGDERVVRTHSQTVGDLVQEIIPGALQQHQVHPALSTALHSGMAVAIEQLYPVQIHVEGEVIEHLSASTMPGNILREAGYRIYPGDKVWIDGTRLLEPDHSLPAVPEEIWLDRGETVTLQLDSVQGRLRSSADSLAAALWEMGRTLYEGDVVIPSASSPIEAVEQPVLHSSRPLAIQVDGKTVHTRAAGPTVGEALTQAGIPLLGLDYSLPSAESALPEDGQVQVVRVEEEVLVELEPLPFETEYRPDPELEIDQQRVIESGTYGVIANSTRIRYEDQVEVGREVEESRVLVQPQPRVLGYGTKIVVRTLATGSGTIEYWRAVPVYATSYLPCPNQPPDCGARTASGKKVEVGMIAVLRSWYRVMQGWPVYVPNYGLATIEDIGGGIAGRHWIDVAYPNEQYIPWSTWTTLYFLTPVPPESSIMYILP